MVRSSVPRSSIKQWDYISVCADIINTDQWPDGFIDSSMSLLRRSIRLFIFICVIFGLSWTFCLSWELPEFRKDPAILTSSRAKLVAAFRSRKQSNVAEIYGLLHLVTADSDEYQHMLTNNVGLDPTEPISLNDYTIGNEDLNWTAEMERLDKEFPLVVFSKVCF